MVENWIQLSGQIENPRRQLTNSLIMQFLNEKVLTGEVNLSKDSERLGKELLYLYGSWKELLFIFGDQREVDKWGILSGLTLKNVASFSKEEYNRCVGELSTLIPDSPEADRLRKEVDKWFKVSEITNIADRLEQERTGS